MNKQVEERSDLTYRLDGLRQAQAALLLTLSGCDPDKLKTSDDK